MAEPAADRLAGEELGLEVAVEDEPVGPLHHVQEDVGVREPLSVRIDRDLEAGEGEVAAHFLEIELHLHEVLDRGAVRKERAHRQEVHAVPDDVFASPGRLARRRDADDDVVLAA